MHQDSPYWPSDAGIPVSMTVHDLNYLERPDYSPERKKRKTRQLQRKIDRCSGLVYISGFVQEQVKSHLQVPAHTCERVIFNGVSPVSAGKTEPAAAPYLFSIGLHPLKNYAVALPLLVAEPELRWVIAGSDVHGHRAKLEEAAGEMGVSDRLQFAGAVTEQEKNVLYAGCRALVFPSLAEGFGLPVLEAMSAGKPVFLSTLTSLPEVGGTEAYYFQDFEPATIISTFRKGISEYDNDPGKRKDLKQWAGHFTWKRQLHIISVFQKFTGKPRKKPTKLKMNLNDLNKIYFIGTGGIGMSALARYFLLHGMEVHGYDRTETPLTRALADEGMQIHYTDDVSYIPEGVDLVVYTPAVPQRPHRAELVPRPRLSGEEARRGARYHQQGQTMCSTGGYAR
jgi:hypothetical protein